GRANSSGPVEGSLSRTSRWSGHTLEIEPFRDTPEEWARTLRNVQHRIGWREESAGTPTDQWKEAPRTVLTILEERRRLPARLRRGELNVDPRTEAEIRARVSEKAGSR